MQSVPLSPLARVVLNIALSLATLIFVLDYSIANVSIPYIAGDLGVSTDQGIYVITSFAVGNGIAVAISGWLTRRFGPTRLLMFSILAFVFFSWMCGLAWSFGMLVVSRFLQGAVAGPLIPLSQTLIYTHNPVERRGFVTAVWSTVVILGPVLGPIIGGWITFDYHWPWIFYINIPIGLIAAYSIWHIIGHEREKTEKEPLEIVGFLLLSIGVTCLQVFLDKGQDWDWWRSDAIRFFSVAAFLCLSFLVLWEVTHPRPLMDFKLLKIRSFWISIVCIATAYAMYFGVVVLVPLWLQSYMGYTAYLAGLAVAPLGFVPLLAAGLSAKAVARFGKLKPLGLSFLIFALSCFYAAYFTTDVDIFHVGLSRLFFGCGFVFFITPLFLLSVQDISEEKLPNATSLFHFIRAIFGGIGTAVFTTMWYRRTIYHHERLGSAITSFTDNKAEFFGDLAKAHVGGLQGRSLLNDAVDDQAAMLAINDCFFVIAWMFLALIVLLFLASLGAKKSSAASSQQIPVASD